MENIIEVKYMEIIHNQEIIKVKVVEEKEISASKYSKDKRKKGTVNYLIVEFPDGRQADYTNIWFVKVEDLSVNERIEYDYYKNKLEYPSSVLKKEIREKFAKNISINLTGNIEEVEIQLKKAKDEALEKANDEIQKLYKEYNNETVENEQKFKRDLANEFEVSNNPKADLLYGKVYEKAHSYGFSEIYSVYSDLVELIK